MLTDLDFNQPPARWRLAFGGPQLEKKCVASRRHALEFFQPGPEFFELAPAHRAFFCHPILLRAKT